MDSRVMKTLGVKGFILTPKGQEGVREARIILPSANVESGSTTVLEPSHATAQANARKVIQLQPGDLIELPDGRTFTLKSFT